MLGVFPVFNNQSVRLEENREATTVRDVTGAFGGLRVKSFPELHLRKQVQKKKQVRQERALL